MDEQAESTSLQVESDEARALDPPANGARPAPRGKSRDGEPDKDAAAQKTSGRRRLTIAIVLVLLLAGIVAGIAWYIHASRFETTDDAFIDGQIVRVSPEVAGLLVTVAVDDNQHVEAGDLLVEIDPAGPMAELALRRAQLAEAEAAVVQAKAQIEQATSQVETARSRLNGDTVAAENARLRADRQQSLFERSGSSAISKQSLDDAVAQARQAEATADASRTGVASAESGVVAARAALRSAEALVEAAKAQVAIAEVTVDHLTVAAPIDGQVVQRNVNLGSYVQPGTQMMAIVPEELYVTANYKETQLGRIRVGQLVDLRIDAFPDIDFKGTVQSIQRGAGQAFQLLPPQNATGNFVKVVQRVPVRISIDSPSLLDHPIGPGMSVVPSIHVTESETAGNQGR